MVGVGAEASSGGRHHGVGMGWWREGGGVGWSEEGENAVRRDDRIISFMFF